MATKRSWVVFKHNLETSIYSHSLSLGTPVSSRILAGLESVCLRMKKFHIPEINHFARDYSQISLQLGRTAKQINRKTFHR